MLWARIDSLTSHSEQYAGGQLNKHIDSSLILLLNTQVIISCSKNIAPCGLEAMWSNALEAWNNFFKSSYNKLYSPSLHNLLPVKMHECTPIKKNAGVYGLNK